jgi:hypothetical protein
MVSNGRLAGGDLTSVQGSIQLGDGTAKAYLGLKRAVKLHLDRTIRIAAPAGGYRSYAVQSAMRTASLHGTKADKAKWGLSSSSTAVLAEAGTSNHGLGICVDIVGTPLDSAFFALAKTYGFTRPLQGDPNHFQYDGHTVVPVIDYKKLGAYLNGRHLGRQTDTAHTGDPDGDYVWLIQAAGIKDGRYPVPPYKHDGKRGPKTDALELHYWEKIS